MADSRIYTQFEDGDIMAVGKTLLTETAWSSDVGGIMTTFYTSSLQVSASGDYYYNIYQTDATESMAVQFAVAYGNAVGSGSYEKFSGMGISGYTPSKAIYSQFANTILPSGTTRFTYWNGVEISDFIAISFQRERLKEVLDPGNWELTLADGSDVTTLVDPYVGINEGDVYEEYDIVSGSLANGVYNIASPVYFGKVYPKYGVMILDGTALRDTASIAVTTSEHNTAATNNNDIFYNALVEGQNFSARNKQSITSNYYFVRVKNNKYNYTTNPTYYTGSYSSKTFKFQDFIYNPISYITTIGLYDNSMNLLAVAKLSKPVKKTKTSECLIRVCLNF